MQAAQKEAAALALKEAVAQHNAETADLRSSLGAQLEAAAALAKRVTQERDQNAAALAKEEEARQVPHQ